MSFLTLLIIHSLETDCGSDSAKLKTAIAEGHLEEEDQTPDTRPPKESKTPKSPPKNAGDDSDNEKPKKTAAKRKPSAKSAKLDDEEEEEEDEKPRYVYHQRVAILY